MERTTESPSDSWRWALAWERSFNVPAGRRLLGLFWLLRGLGAFALITLSVMVRKAGIARSVIQPLIFKELLRSGWRLLPMTLFFAVALGLVVIGQTVTLLSQVGANEYLGAIMASVVVRELGPLLTVLLVLLRVGTANVVELGTARALGEVEAIEAMSIDPIHYLVVPRVIGMALGVFTLTIYLILGALVSGYLWAFLRDVALLPGAYFEQLAAALGWLDFALLALKTISFGAIIAVVTCYHGLARPLTLTDVSSATVRAVSQSFVLCVMADGIFLMIFLLAQ